MNGQAIPGFYYDTEKKKYFKIQSQAAAQGLDLRYTSSNLAKSQRQETIQKAAAAKTTRTKKERVIRRHGSSFIQTDLEREIGFRRKSFYLQTIYPGACTSGLPPTPRTMTTSDQNEAIRFFDRDPVSKTLYAAVGENTIKRRHHVSNSMAANLSSPTSRDRLKSLSTKERYAYYPWDELGRTTSPVSSMQYMPTSGALAVTTIGSDRPPVIQLSDPERDGPHISQQFTPRGCSAIFTSSARPQFPTFNLHRHTAIPETTTEHLAVAAQSSLLLFTRTPTGSWGMSTALSDLGSDILALTWLSRDTLALGLRSGEIHTHDVRSRGSAHILTHATPVVQLARADDETRMVCAGLSDTLVLYDVRHSRAGSKDRATGPSSSGLCRGSRTPKRRRRNIASPCATASGLGPGPGQCSIPLLTFTHSNTDNPHLSVAVSPRHGLVAAAQDTQVGSSSDVDVGIRVSNLWTGKVVREFGRPDGGRGGNRGRGEGRAQARGLKWMDDGHGYGHGDGGLGLWCAVGDRVVEYAW